VASFTVSVAIPDGRPGWCLVRDDTVSVPVLAQVPVPQGGVVPFIVSFPLVIRDPGCAARPGLGTCNTNCPWRPAPAAGIVVP